MTKTQMTPHDIALHAGKFDMVSIISNYELKRGIEEKKIELVISSIHHGADVFSVRGSTGLSALLFACRYGHGPVAEYLVETKLMPVDDYVESPAYHGRCDCLCLAASHDHADTVQTLLALQKPWNVAHARVLAVTHKFEEIVQILDDHIEQGLSA